MTFEELQKIVPDARRSEWNQSPEGGWISVRAVVSPTARVKDNAIVYPDAIVEGYAVVSGNAQILPHAEIYDYGEATHHSIIMPFGRVRNYAQAYENAVIYGTLYGHAKVGGTARVQAGVAIGAGDIKSGVWTRPPIYIHGSKYDVYQTGPDTVRCGCLERSIDEWCQECRRLGDVYGLTADQIWEYEQYFRLIRSVCNRRGI
jgi:hypothetical protein